MKGGVEFWMVVGGFIYAFWVLFRTYWMYLPLIVLFLCIRPVVLKVNSFWKGGWK